MLACLSVYSPLLFSCSPAGPFTLYGEDSLFVLQHTEGIAIKHVFFPFVSD